MSVGEGDAEPLLFPVSYWPARTGGHWWDDVRTDEVVRDFELACAVGASVLHVTVPWDTSQPYSERVSLGLMRDLDTVLRIAADIGIQCLVSIAVASVFEAVTLPTWFYELSADEMGHPVRVLRRLYEDPVVIKATARLCDELTGEFGTHPSAVGWIIGDGLLAASAPREAEYLEEWLERVGTSLHVGRRRIWHGVGARDLARRKALRLPSLARVGLGCLIHVDWQPSWARDTALWTSFLVSYARGLGSPPPLILGSARFPCPPPHASEDAVHSCLAQIRVAGAAGVIWPALVNYDPVLGSRPPFSLVPWELSRGLLPRDGKLSPAARGWLDGTVNPGTVARPALPRLDEDVRARDPEGFMRAVYQEYVG